MNRITTLLATSTLTLVGMAQQDSVQTKDAEGTHKLTLGYNSAKGAEVRVDRIDTTVVTNGHDTIRIEFKRSIVTILTEPKKDSTSPERLAQRMRELRRERRNLFTYWAGVDFGFNNWVGPDGSTELDSASAFMELIPGRSRYVAINFMEQKIEFGSHRAGIYTGLGLEYNSYRLANNVLLAYDKDSTYAMPVESPTYSKNKLRQTGLRVPLMLEFNTKRAPMPSEADLGTCGDTPFDRKGNFHIAFGVIGSLYLETMYKVKYTRDGETIKDRSSGNYNLQPYRLAAAVRFGYGGLNLYAEYALTPLFRDGHGPELTPFNVGITLAAFN